jgi:Helix-turn-helix domain
MAMTDNTPQPVGPDTPVDEWEPEDWLAHLDEASHHVAVERTPDDRYERAGDPDYHDKVTAGLATRDAAQRLVSTLAELRRAIGLTQVAVADRWGTPQPVVSRLEADPARVEVATLAAYVRALGGHLAIDADIDGEHYHYELV